MPNTPNLDDKLPIINSLSYLNTKLNYAAYLLRAQSKKIPNAKQLFSQIKATKDALYSFSLHVEAAYKVTKRIVATLEMLTIQTFGIIRSFASMKDRATNNLQLFTNYVLGKNEEHVKTREATVKQNIHNHEKEKPDHEKEKLDLDNGNPFSIENFTRNRNW